MVCSSVSALQYRPIGYVLFALVLILPSFVSWRATRTSFDWKTVGPNNGIFSSVSGLQYRSRGYGYVHFAASGSDTPLFCFSPSNSNIFWLENSAGSSLSRTCHSNSSGASSLSLRRVSRIGCNKLYFRFCSRELNKPMEALIRMQNSLACFDTPFL